MSAPPPVAFDYDTRFLPMDFRGDIGRWAKVAAKTAWERSGREHGRRDVKHLASTLETLAELTRRLNPMGAFAFVPEPWAGVAGVVRVLALDLGAPMEMPELVAQLSYPQEQLAAPVEIGVLDTPLGQAATLHQLTVTEDGVQSSRQFLWLFPDLEAAVVTSIAFTDPLQSARWKSALEDLARGADLETSALTEPPA